MTHATTSYITYQEYLAGLKAAQQAAEPRLSDAKLAEIQAENALEATKNSQRRQANLADLQQTSIPASRPSTQKTAYEILGETRVPYSAKPLIDAKDAEELGFVIVQRNVGGPGLHKCDLKGETLDKIASCNSGLLWLQHLVRDGVMRKKSRRVWKNGREVSMDEGVIHANHPLAKAGKAVFERKIGNMHITTVIPVSPGDYEPIGKMDLYGPFGEAVKAYVSSPQFERKLKAYYDEFGSERAPANHKTTSWSWVPPADDVRAGSNDSRFDSKQTHQNRGQCWLPGTHPTDELYCKETRRLLSNADAEEDRIRKSRIFGLRPEDSPISELYDPKSPSYKQWPARNELDAWKIGTEILFRLEEAFSASYKEGKKADQDTVKRAQETQHTLRLRRAHEKGMQAARTAYESRSRRQRDEYARQAYYTAFWQTMRDKTQLAQSLESSPEEETNRGIGPDDVVEAINTIHARLGCKANGKQQWLDCVPRQLRDALATAVDRALWRNDNLEMLDAEAEAELDTWLRERATLSYVDGILQTEEEPVAEESPLLVTVGQ
jgi:hypothetical protein